MENKKILQTVALSNKIRIFLAMGGIILAFCSLSALYADNYYPPRVSYVEGGVSYESAGDVDWTEATVNLPIFRGDRVYAQPGSRGEIEFGYNSFLRLDENTDVMFSHLSKKAVNLNLALGSVIVRAGKSFKMDVQTPAGLIQLDDRGLYRIDTDETGLTRVMVRKGEAEIIGAGDKVELRDGQMTTFGGDPSLHQAAYDSYEDDFDLWSSRRDAIYASSESVEYVGGYYPGIHTLDSYGYWRTYPTLGRVWIPRVGVGWSPYRSGLWLNFSVGWTWLSYEPWGWLPYHHGYWHYYEPYGHWVWSPGFYGGYTSFGAWSPHCVNFYYGSGYIGWAPRPWGYGTRPNNTVINNTNIIINNNNINNSRGMTVVKATDFSRRRVETTMVRNVSSDVRNSFKTGLPETLTRTSSRSSLAAGTASQSRAARSGILNAAESRTAASAKAGSEGLTRETPASTRAADYKSSRGSAGTVSRSTDTAAATRSITTREGSPGRSEPASRMGRSSTRGLSESNVRSIPSREGYTSRSTVRSGNTTAAGPTARERIGSSSERVTIGRSGSETASPRVRSIPSPRDTARGYTGSTARSSGGRVTSTDSRVRSLTGSSVTPRITTDTRTSNATAGKTYRDRSSGTSFWKRIFGGSSSSNRGSSSGGSYSRSRSYGSSGSISRPSGSSSRPSYSRPSSGSSRPSYSRPSSSRPGGGSRPSSSSRPRRPN